MTTEQIPLIIPVFNQMTFTKGLIESFRKFYPKNRIYILNNGSTYPPLLEWLKETDLKNNVCVFNYKENAFRENLRHFLDSYIIYGYEYYAISDPDILIPDYTPGNFLEMFKALIDEHNYHRAGFGLKTEDIPDYIHDKAMIVANENELKTKPVWFYKHQGYIAPLDTTFCLYKTSNGGWSSPMNGKDWGNCVRLLEARHLGWYIDPSNVSEEMDYYFKTANYRVPGQPSAGANNNRPQQYI